MGPSRSFARAARVNARRGDHDKTYQGGVAEMLSEQGGRRIVHRENIGSRRGDARVGGSKTRGENPKPPPSVPLHILDPRLYVHHIVDLQGSIFCDSDRCGMLHVISCRTRTRMPSRLNPVTRYPALAAEVHTCQSDIDSFRPWQMTTG